MFREDGIFGEKCCPWSILLYKPFLSLKITAVQSTILFVLLLLLFCNFVNIVAVVVVAVVVGRRGSRSISTKSFIFQRQI